MVIQVEKLPVETRRWLDDRASSRGTSADLEAAILLDDAVQDRIRRERLFLAASQARVRLPGPSLTPQEIDDAINWGRG